MMIKTIIISKNAQKDLKQVPKYIQVLLQDWVDDVEDRGLEEVRRIPGYHDEPLRGERRGQRSIRLTRAWRAIYRIIDDKVIFVYIEEINKHDY